jgi:hypothetical protein
MLAHQPLIQEQVVQVQLLLLMQLRLQEPEAAVEEMILQVNKELVAQEAVEQADHQVLVVLQLQVQLILAVVEEVQEMQTLAQVAQVVQV